MTSWNIIRTQLKKVLSDSHRVQDLQQCFPKSSLLPIFVLQGFLFWSTRKKTSHLLQNNWKMCSKIYIFQPFICKTINYSNKLFIHGPQNYIFNDFVVCQNIIVSKLNKFGKQQACQKLQESPGPQKQTFFLNYILIDKSKNQSSNDWSVQWIYFESIFCLDWLTIWEWTIRPRIG